MSGLLALLDDVAALTKVAAASVDDIAAQAAKAGAKAAGAVIDDAAVTPKYLTGFSPERELPIVWKIARGSIVNKLVILLPVALLLSQFAPWAIPPLLMMGGAYLCYEGAEKILHAFRPHSETRDPAASDPAHLEEARVKGAIKTDFILSAEIMTIALSALEAPSLIYAGFALALVAIGITALVYGSVALIVKADDVGLHLAHTDRAPALQRLGRGIVAAMPSFLLWLTRIGTAAMLWVGGAILLHGAAQLGWPAPEEMLHHLSLVAADAVAAAHGVVEWAVFALGAGILGLGVGACLIPLVALILPLFPKKKGV